MRRFLSFVFCFMLIPSFVDAQTTNEPDDAWRRKAPVTSHLKNVVVVGLPKEIALDVAIWAESVIEKIQSWAQASLPGSYVYPLVIRAETREQEKQGFVIASQQMTDDGHLRQGLTIVNPTLVDREDVLEGLCHLLLNRWIHVRQTRDSLAERPGQFPQWFTYGIAQSLFPDLMGRNHRFMEQEERKGRYRPALSIVLHQVLPPGRWPEKAHAGLVMKWLAQQVSGATLIAEAAAAVANDEVLDEAFLLRQLNVDDVKTFNAQWDLWMARQEELIVPGLTAGDTDKLSRILEMRAEDLGLAHPAIARGDNVPPDLLIKERNEQWARDVSSIMVWRLRLESVGKMPSIQDAVTMYLEFFDLILKPPNVIRRNVNKRKKKVLKPPSTRQVKKAWKKAERNWAKLVENTTDRKAYLDTYDQPNPVTRDDVHQWLDEWQSENP